ncbi:hypothetical protein ARHIZOSPH14_29880 [Agromyces rhizosphaerae]|uniref:Aminoglycoside phosphotransferase domain-containing protein n=1 Tax=Agromyces rhizosphaerae TaxID=88374 RepID=A0A9W6CZB5_9MICO|nr:phosphotransferase [Agromyces rhizosphaerae]GLI28746.1 hypothetical protein ARHIZOSPH14_29880 [Agromyces rhizosphaerae]
MPDPFSEHVSSPEWLAATEGRVRRMLREVGVRPTGPLERRRVRPWSTQLTIATDAGTVWCKQNHPAMAFEARVQAVLAELVADAVQAPLAIDAGRGLLLMTDHGPSVAERGQVTTDVWARLVGEAARLQRSLVGRRTDLVGAGVPDRSIRVEDRFEDLVELLAGLPAPHPARLVDADASRLRAAGPAVADAVRVLADSPYPSAWNHGDLHPGNAFPLADGVRLFDLADGQWANALEVLAVPHDWIDRQPDLAWEPVRDAWAAAWGLRPPTAEEWRSMRIVHAVNRTGTWTGVIDDMTEPELRRWAHYAADELLGVLRHAGGDYADFS